MNRTATERRLAAILVADIVGYSRLMNADEEGTLARLRSLRAELIDETVKRHRGRIVKSMGDGVLVEFASAVNAVCCAVEVQHFVGHQNIGVAEPKQIWLRVGINVGELMVEPDGDVFGDCVNLAARLEGIAPSGGICLSRAVRDQIRDRVALSCQDLGERALKNIARPVRVFEVTREAIAGMTIDRHQQISLSQSPDRKNIWVVATGLSVLMVSSGFVGLRSSGYFMSPLSEKAAVPAMTEAQRSLELRTPRLSIVVLPFANLNHDPDQDYFTESVTADLTTDLSRIDGSFVIASGTALSYKDKSTDPRQVARELGVRYVLTGSVRRAGEQVRINVELVDAATGAQIWSERFDGDRTTTAELQDNLVARLARSLDVELTDAESRRAEQKTPDNVDADDLAMRGWSVLNRPISQGQLAEAQGLFEKSLGLDPRETRARIGLARTLAAKVNARLSDSQEADLARADNLNGDVLSSEPANAMAQFVKADILRARKQFDSAIATYKTAIALDRNFAPAYGAMASALLRAGQSAEAIHEVDTAVRLSPHDPLLSFWLYIKGHAYAHLMRDQDAVDWCLKSLAAPAAPYWLNYVDLAASYAWLGRDDDAKSAVRALLKVKPGYTVGRWRHEGWSDDPVFLNEYERISEGLQKAGLPE